MKATIIGIEKIIKVNKDTGETTVSHNLHVARDSKKGDNTMDGRRVEEIWCSFDLPEGVKVGSRCDFEFEVVETRNGAFKRLEDIELLGQMNISITPISANAGK